MKTCRNRSKRTGRFTARKSKGTVRSCFTAGVTKRPGKRTLSPVTTWHAYLGQRMGPLMRSGMGHGDAMQKIGAEWRAQKGGARKRRGARASHEEYVVDFHNGNPETFKSLARAEKAIARYLAVKRSDLETWSDDANDAVAYHPEGDSYGAGSYDPRLRVVYY